MCPGEEIQRGKAAPQSRPTRPQWPLSPGQRGPVLPADRHAAEPRGRRVPSSALRRSPAAPPPRQVGSHGSLSQPGSAPRRRAPIRRPRELPLGCGRPRQNRAELRRGGSPARPLRARDCRTGLRAAAPKPGLARGCSAAGGEGGRLPAQNQLDQLGAGPRLLPESRSGVPGTGAGAGPKDRGQAELAAWKST